MAFSSRQFKSSFFRSAIAFVFSLTAMFPYLSYATADFENTETAVKKCEASKTELIGSGCNKNGPAMQAAGAAVESQQTSAASSTTEKGQEAIDTANTGIQGVTGAQATCEKSMWTCTETCKADVEKAAAEDLETCQEAAEKKCAGPKKATCLPPLHKACLAKKEELTKRGETALAACKFNRTAFAGIAGALLAGLGALAMSGGQQKQGTQAQQQNQQQQPSNQTQTAAAEKSCPPGGGLACICKNNPSSDSRCGKCWDEGTRQLKAGCKLDDGTTVGGAGTGDTQTAATPSSASSPSSQSTQSTTINYNASKEKQNSGDLGQGSQQGGTGVAAKSASTGRSMNADDRMLNGMSLDGKKSSDVAGQGEYSAAGDGGSSFNSSQNSELARYFPGRSKASRDSASEAAATAEADRAQLAPKTSNIWANLSRAYKNAKLIEQ